MTLDTLPERNRTDLLVSIQALGRSAFTLDDVLRLPDAGSRAEVEARLQELVSEGSVRRWPSQRTTEQRETVFVTGPRTFREVVATLRAAVAREELYRS